MVLLASQRRGKTRGSVCELLSWMMGSWPLETKASLVCQSSNCMDNPWSNFAEVRSWGHLGGFLGETGNCSSEIRVGQSWWIVDCWACWWEELGCEQHTPAGRKQISQGWGCDVFFCQLLYAEELDPQFKGFCCILLVLPLAGQALSIAWATVILWEMMQNNAYDM